MAASACECFNKLQEGTIDDRLFPCLSQPINNNIEEIHKNYRPNDPIETALSNYMMDVTVTMIHTCDKYFFELDSMYTNMYPVTDYSFVQQKIEIISDSINIPNLSDSLKISLLHKKISHLTEARKFDEAMESIKWMSNEFSNESEMYWVKAYIHRGLGEYDLAIVELDNAIDSGNESSRIFKELIKRKKVK
jgi:hypothetical protein